MKLIVCRSYSKNNFFPLFVALCFFCGAIIKKKTGWTFYKRFNLVDCCLLNSLGKILMSVYVS